MNPKIKEFFEGYERANSEFDIAKLAACYADVFMFGNSQGVQSVKKEDFVRVLPRRKEFVKAAGLVASKIERMEASELGAGCSLVNAAWKMRIERAGKEAVESENATTYISREVFPPKPEPGLSGAPRLEIVFQLDHQDLMKRVQEG